MLTPPTWDKGKDNVPKKDKYFKLKIFLNNYIPKEVCKQCGSKNHTLS